MAEKLSRANLPIAVKSAMHECMSERGRAQTHPVNYSLVRDLTVALEALKLIDSEICGQRQRQVEERSAAFTRYVLDEGPKMVMNTDLREKVLRIEEAYGRYF